MTGNVQPPFDTLAPYRGRWVALVRHRVAGVGAGAAQAYRAAKVVCPKDRPQLFFVDETGVAHVQPDDFSIWFEHPLLRQVADIWQRQGQEAYLVGGGVRDGLLGRFDVEADLDLLVPRNALEAARHLADALRAAYYPLDPRRDVGRVVLPDHRYLDIAAYRGDTLPEDLQDRDFTINAMIIRLDAGAPCLLDPLDGQADLRRGIIRVASGKAITNDPLRTVRAVRLAARLGFTIEPDTRRRIEKGAAGLKAVSGERLRDEMLKLLATDQPGTAVAMLGQLKILPHLLPEALAMAGVEQSPPHHLPVFEHTLLAMDSWSGLATLDDPRLAALTPLKAELQAYLQTELAGNVSRAALMPLVLLLHDTGKPQTFSRGSDGRIHFWRHPQVGADIARQVMDRWHFSGQATRFVTTAVRHHMRPLLLSHQPRASRRAIHRLLEAAGDAAPALALLSLMDHLATYRPG
ncbi:MAG: HD domain-containing protein, partial [Anaerolineae bacterium]